MHLISQVNMYDPPQTLPLPKVVNLIKDLKEERDVGATDSWVGVPMTKIIIDLELSLKKYPPIQAGTPEPYVPPEIGDRAQRDATEVSGPQFSERF